MDDPRLKGFGPMLLTALGAALAFWLLQDHWGHVLGALPYLLFLACPLMHLVMHRGHAHHGGSHDAPP